MHTATAKLFLKRCPRCQDAVQDGTAGVLRCMDRTQACLAVPPALIARIIDVGGKRRYLVRIVRRQEAARRSSPMAALVGQSR